MLRNRLALRLGTASLLICISQAIGIVSGVVSIRLLPVREYGAYLLGLSVVQMGLLLTDLGIAASATALVAGSSNPVLAFRSVRRELIVLRGIMSALWLTACLILYPLYLRFNPPSQAAEVTPLHILLVSLVFFSLMWFHSQTALYRGLATVQAVAITDLQAALLRAAITIGAVLVAPSAISGLNGMLLSYMAGALFVEVRIRSSLRAVQSDKSETDTDPGKVSLPSLRRTFAPLVMPTIFFALQSYVTTMLLVQRGTVFDLAVFGATTRFSQIYALLGAVNSAVLQPFISRMPGTEDWRKIALVTMFGVSAGVGCIIFAAWLFSGYLVRILGTQYTDYAFLIPYGFIGSSLYFLGTVAYGILISRGETKGQWLTIPFGIAGIAGGIYLLEPRTVIELMYFEGIRSGAYLLCQCTLLVRWLYRSANSQPVDVSCS
jgi:O-antigen/teichoic acid export membrane protein